MPPSEPAAPASGTVQGTTPPAPPPAPPAASLAPAGAPPAAVAPAGEPPKGFIDPATGKPPESPPAAPGAAAEPYKLALPEGASGISPKLVEAYNQFALAQKLPKEAAQAQLEWYAKTLDEQTKAEAAAFEQRMKDAQKALEAHPRIGGAKYQESIAHAQAAIVTLNSAVDGLGTRAWEKLTAAGLGYDPDVAELLTTIGERMKEDSIGTPRPAGGEKQLSKAQKLAKEFPSLAEDIRREGGGG